MLISDKAHFQGRKTIRVKEGQYKMINRSFLQEGITTLMCSTQPQSIKIYDVKTYRTAIRKHRQIHYYSQSLQHPSIRNGEFKQTKYQ